MGKCICQPLRVALEGRYMTPDDIVRAASVLIHSRGARIVDMPRLIAAISAADDVAAHSGVPVSSAFATLTSQGQPWNLYFFPYSGKDIDRIWQHIAHAAIHGIVSAGRLDMDDDALLEKLNRMISTCHSAEGLTRRIAQLVGTLDPGSPEKHYDIAVPKKSASAILNQLRGPHA